MNARELIMEAIPMVMFARDQTNWLDSWAESEEWLTAARAWLRAHPPTDGAGRAENASQNVQVR